MGVCLLYLQNVNERWNSLNASSDKLYTWDLNSTYIKSPPFFDGLVIQTAVVTMSSISLLPVSL